MDDIRKVMKEIEAAGGKVLGGNTKPGEPDDIPEVGLFCDIVDPEGNLVTIYEDRSPNPTSDQQALLS